MTNKELIEMLLGRGEDQELKFNILVDKKELKNLNLTYVGGFAPGETTLIFTGEKE